MLPSDFKSFLLLSDGLLLRWYIDLHGVETEFGLMHVNSIRSLKSVAVMDSLPTDTEEEDSSLWFHGEDSGFVYTRCLVARVDCRGGECILFSLSLFSSLCFVFLVGPDPTFRCSSFLRAFDLDHLCTCGRVCFLYQGMLWYCVSLSLFFFLSLLFMYSSF